MRKVVITSLKVTGMKEQQIDSALVEIVKALLRKVTSLKSPRARQEQASLHPTRIGRSKFLSVLLLEEDCFDATRAVCVLNRAGFKVSAHVVKTENAFRSRIAAHTFDIVLADYRIGTWSGLKALEILQQTKSGIPLIILTAIGRNDIAAECIQKGADDYVFKEDLHLLPSAMREAIGRTVERLGPAYP